MNRQLIKEYLSLYPNLKTYTLAKKIFDENKGVFDNFHNLRQRLCYFPEGDGGGGGDTTVQVDHKPGGDSGYVAPTLDMKTALPPEYRDKPYFKDKDFVTVIKEHDNLQKLLGQRPAGIPKEDASPEEWGKFIGAIRPKSADEYEFPETDFSKANKRSDVYIKEAKELLFNAGVPKRQAAEIIKGYESFISKSMAGKSEADKAATETREKEFETLLDTQFKAEKPQVIERTKKLMEESVPAEMRDRVKAVLKDIPNEQLFVLTSVLDGIYKKYVAEDAPPGGSGNSSGDAGTLQTEAEAIMKSEAYRDFRNPGYDSSRQKVQELFKQISQMRK